MELFSTKRATSLLEISVMVSNDVWAQDTTQLRTTDGMCIDDKGNIWVADFSANAVARIDKDGKIQRIAQSPDCDGSDGGLDQPGEPIVWNGQVIVSCFDLVTGPDKVNTGHDKPVIGRKKIGTRHGLRGFHGFKCR